MARVKRVRDIGKKGEARVRQGGEKGEKIVMFVAGGRLGAAEYAGLLKWAHASPSHALPGTNRHCCCVVCCC